MRKEKERPFKEVEKEMKEKKEEYFVEKIQNACDIVKRIGKDPDERSDLVIAVFNKIVEDDFIGDFERIFKKIEDELDEIVCHLLEISAQSE